MSRLVELTAGDAAATFDLQGGRLNSLKVRGIEFLTGIYEHELDLSFQSGIFPMAPFAGRIRDGMFEFDGQRYDVPLDLPPHGAHGTVRKLLWAVEQYSADRVVVTTPLSAEWPFKGSARQEVVLADDRLVMSMSVTAGEAAMPTWIGYHPWFQWQLQHPDGFTSGKAEVEFLASGMYERDDQRLPTGRVIDVPSGPYDDTFTGLDRVHVTWPGSAHLALTADTNTWVIFTSHPGGVCVEPQTAPPDALALGVAPRLEVGQTQSLHFEIAWSF